MKSRLPQLALAVAALAALVLWLIFAPPAVVTLKSPTFQVMGTFAHIIAVGDEEAGDQAIRDAISQLRRVEELMSDFDADSELSRINRLAAAEPVEVGDDIFEVIVAAIEVSKLTGGAFDVTVGPMAQLWRNAGRTGEAPTDEEITAARELIGYDKLILDDDRRTIRFERQGMRIDLGGIAKGYGIDLAVEAMKQAGAVGGMIDVGGDVRVFGHGPGAAKSWRIGVQRPAPPGEVREGELQMVLSLNDVAVATSGDYQRFVMVDGKPLGHIVNPGKGSWGAQSLSSVSVFAAEAVTADAWATAVSVLGPERGLELIENTPAIEAILITAAPEYEVTTTSGAADYIRE